MSTLKQYTLTQEFKLESGAVIPGLRIGYHTFGSLNSDCSNVVWVCHAFTANSNPLSWWSGLFGEAKLYDPAKHFIVCANIIGSPYGSTNPLDVNESTNRPYLQDFPLVTVRDLVRAFDVLRVHLGISRITSLVGGSMGGYQALEWSIYRPELIQNLILIATNARQSAWAIAWNESQRMTIRADRTFFSGDENGGQKGLSAARSIALLSYRNYNCYEEAQSDQDTELEGDRRASSYQRYQGKKLVDRFNAYSYYSLLDLMDTHDVSRNRGSLDVALSLVKAETLVIGIKSDEKFPIHEQKEIAEGIRNCTFRSIDSKYGHDGFLIETLKIDKLLRQFYNEKTTNTEMKTDKKIGLFGYGCVGQGLHDVLNESTGFKSEIEKIAIKNPNKERRLADHYFTTDSKEILDDLDIDLVVELIDNADDAYHIVKKALEGGKNVVSANKKLIADHFKELVDLQRLTGRALLYEAAVCGGIPIIRTLEEYYDNEGLKEIQGIFNGSSNYILSKVINDGKSYEEALKEAQDLGFAESDPLLDVGGYDAKYKSVILAGHGFGVFVNPDEVFNYGIQNLRASDVEYAASLGKKIKLIAKIGKSTNGKVYICVLPELVDSDNVLFNVENEFNGVRVEASYSDAQFFIGKGAGGHPTGSAVLSDISANSFNYRYEYKKAHGSEKLAFSNDYEIEVYLRFGDSRLEEPLFFNKVIEQTEEYVIGSVSIKELLKKKSELEERGAFVLSLGSPVPEGLTTKKESLAHI